MEADSQPLTRQFVSEVSIKMFEDELTDATSHSSFLSQSKDPPLDTLGWGWGSPSSSRHPLEDFGGLLWRDDRCKVPVVIHVAVQGHDERLHRLSPPATRGLAPLTLVAVVGGWMGGFSVGPPAYPPGGFSYQEGERGMSSNQSFKRGSRGGRGCRHICRHITLPQGG